MYVCACRFLWVLVELRAVGATIPLVISDIQQAGALCAGVDLQSSVGSGRVGFSAVFERKCVCLRCCSPR